MTWATATDDQLRRAAAERVLGWTMRGGGRIPRIWASGADGNGVITERYVSHFIPDESHDDLALVFMSEVVDAWVEARNRKDFRVNNLWGLALVDPRAALCGLLELLYPEGMNDE